MEDDKPVAKRIRKDNSGYSADIELTNESTAGTAQSSLVAGNDDAVAVVTHEHTSNDMHDVSPTNDNTEESVVSKTDASVQRPVQLPNSSHTINASRELNSVRAGKKEIRMCPYLGTVNRHVLDFDFEKLCSISMANEHVYCCLVCGRNFQGRGISTYAYTHSLEESHFVFINLSNSKIYCLPESYEVHDASMNDIKYYLNPRYSKKDMASLAKTAQFSKSLDGADYMPGYVGLNNLKHSDFFTVVVQMLCQVIPLRNKLLLLDLSRKLIPDPVLLTLSELVRKIFNPKNFKGIVSPHEFLQAVGVHSEKKFRIGKREDPVAFFSWLMGKLHPKLRQSTDDPDDSVVHQSFRGEILVKTFRVTSHAGHPIQFLKEQKVPFILLTLNLPSSPVFKDSFERNIIPQVPIFDLLQKFDGEMETESTPGEVRKYSLWKLPAYLVLHVKRFSKNNFFVEKNRTIVTFPVKNLDMQDYLHPDAVVLNAVTRYDLVANICHVGKPHEGFYKIHVCHAATNEWYEMEDLRISPVIPQLVALSESYVQVFQRQDVRPDGTFETPVVASPLGVG
eukprot:Lankesteria_metandrocarpae@DN6369_c0_g1_i1.p1